MEVGIVTQVEDLHAYAVKAAIEAHGATCHVFTPGALEHASALLSDVEVASTLKSSESHLVDIIRLDSIWYRRAIDSNPTSKPPLDPASTKFVSANIHTTIQGALDASFIGKWIDDPYSTHRAENKLLQLAVASRVGFRIPETLVSQDLDGIREFCDAHPSGVIVKAVRGTPETRSLTKRVTEEHLGNRASIESCPAIYQELVPGTRHLRVHIFGEACLTALLNSEDLDWRPRLAAARVQEYTLASEIEGKARAALRQLGLTMGVFDFKLTDDGECVWIELNPQGQFLFLEALCGIPLTQAISNHLLNPSKSLY
ncbi:MULTISPECIES: hypothetical protein [Streptomyces]|uniref:hypothetical protein n=1 Tax=Streptomyces TaxID=1883 RepID=UPI000AEE8F04|nr:hypothetical protein [Streptomyces virginiae]